MSYATIFKDTQEPLYKIDYLSGERKNMLQTIQKVMGH